MDFGYNDKVLVGEWQERRRKDIVNREFDLRTQYMVDFTQKSADRDVNSAWDNRLYGQVISNKHFLNKLFQIDTLAERLTKQIYLFKVIVIGISFFQGLKKLVFKNVPKHILHCSFLFLKYKLTYIFWFLLFSTFKKMPLAIIIQQHAKFQCR